jgi:hypothetical protein
LLGLLGGKPRLEEGDGFLLGLATFRRKNREAVPLD